MPNVKSKDLRFQPPTIGCDLELPAIHRSSSSCRHKMVAVGTAWSFWVGWEPQKDAERGKHGLNDFR